MFIVHFPIYPKVLKYLGKYLGFVMDAWRRMEKVATSLLQEISIQATGGVDRCHADEQWPPKLIWPRKDNGRQKGQHLEEILERRLESGESSSVDVLYFLLPCQFTEKCTWNEVGDLHLE